MRPLCQDWARWLFYLIHRNQHRESRKMKKQWNVFQTKELDRTPEIDLNEMEISGLPESSKYREVIQMLTKVRTMHEQSENFNKEKILKSTKQKSQS